MPILLIIILVCVCLILLGAVAGKPLGWVVVGLAVLGLLEGVQLPALHARDLVAWLQHGGDSSAYEAPGRAF